MSVPGTLSHCTRQASTEYAIEEIRMEYGTNVSARYSVSLHEAG